ncbi:MAG: mycofactocin biosynthesis peptidyl-dipeptidase MftE [Acidimicrobiales bacterium]
MGDDRDLGPRTTAAVARAAPTVLLVPLGSTEQHGPHLPLDTDTRIAVAWAGAVAARLPGAVTAPAVAYGSAGEHQAFPGTLSIGQDALRAVVIELARSAAHLVDAVAYLSGHAGNTEPLAAAVTQLQAEGHRVDAVVPSWPADRWPPGTIDAHAGRTETSLLLHLDPTVVALDQAEPGETAPVGELLGALRRHGLAGVTPNGVLGDPTGASAGEGRRLFDDLVTRTVRRLGETIMDPKDLARFQGVPPGC